MGLGAEESEDSEWSRLRSFWLSFESEEFLLDQQSTVRENAQDLDSLGGCLRIPPTSP